MGFSFIPYYINYLGIENYGLIGFFVIIQGALTLLDMGMTPALGRESAKFIGGGLDANEFRLLIRTYEIIACIIISLALLIVFLLSSDIVNYWMNLESVSFEDARSSVVLMGVLFGLRFGEGIYRSILIGIQQHVSFNLANALLATLRWGGIVFVFEYYSATVLIYFWWNIIISIIAVIVFAYLVYRVSGVPNIYMGISLNLIKRNWRFTGGMALITLSAFILTNLDKLIVSNKMTLSEYGLYTIIITLTSALALIAMPISQSFLPKLIEENTKNDHIEFARLFYLGTQLITSIIGSAAIIIIFFPDLILQIWLKDEGLSKLLQKNLAIYTIGTLLNCLSIMPYLNQIAKGKTELAVKFNFISIIFLTPSLYFFIDIYGLTAAAVIWLIYNGTSFIIGPYFSLRKNYCISIKEWYIYHTIIPLIVMISVAFIMRCLVVFEMSKLEAVIFLLLSYIILLTISIFTSRSLKNHAFIVVKKLYVKIYKQ